MNLISQINDILKKFETGDKLKSYKELQKIFKKNKSNNLLPVSNFLRITLI